MVIMSDYSLCIYVCMHVIIPSDNCGISSFFAFFHWYFFNKISLIRYCYLNLIHLFVSLSLFEDFILLVVIEQLGFAVV